MENKSILDQIITNQKAEEIARLNAVEIIASIFNSLNERERDVLSRRFGLQGGEKETLENIGKVHNLTRERIRQIETTGVKKLRQIESLNEHIKGLKKVITQLLEEHGGLMEKKYLLNSLVKFSVDGISSRADSNENVHKSNLEFLISKLLHTEFEEVNNSKVFKESFKFKFQDLEHLEDLALKLVEEIEKTKKIFFTEELIDLTKELETFKNNPEKFKTPNNVDISGVLKKEFFSEDPDLINENKVLYTILQAHKKVEQNKFGHWGINDWREVKPKTINDKIYLILKNNGKPMHFVEISERINQTGFDKKKANPATVHNELILDKKYILVGRGLYSLKEWGYQSGTVADVIIDVMEKNNNEPLTRDEVIQRVLDQRIVKKATIILALMNKEKFERLDNGKYRLKK